MQNTQLHSQTRRGVDFLKAVVFQMGSLNLALPAKDVYRVLKQTPVYSSGLNNLGMVQVGDRQATVVDLHRRLFQSSITSQSSQGSHIVVVKTKEGELYGIPVAAVPVLMDIALASIQVLPQSYRHTNILEMASHYCHVSVAEQSKTVFLLNPEQL